MAVIGRAFHWMDRAETLRRLDQMILPDGAVVLFGDDHPEVPDNDWRADYRALIDAFARGDPAREQWRKWRKGRHFQHEAVLLDSAFKVLERIGVIERRRIEIERLVDRALSMSSTSPGRLGTQADELADRIRELAARHAVGGFIIEVVESVALIARRQRRAASRIGAARPFTVAETRHARAEINRERTPAPCANGFHPRAVAASHARRAWRHGTA